MTTVTSRSSVRPLPVEGQRVAKTPLALPGTSGNGSSAHGGRASEHRLGMATIAACALLMLLVPLVSYPPALRVPAGLVLTMMGPGYAGLALLRACGLGDGAPHANRGDQGRDIRLDRNPARGKNVQTTRAGRPHRADAGRPLCHPRL